jgi:hypothetical protein
MAVATAKLARWSSERPEDGTPDYLLGRNFYLQGRYEDAAQRLDRALARKLSEPRVEREALRTRLIVGCALGDRAAALRARGAWLTLPKTRAAQRSAVLRFSERCGLPAPPAEKGR